MMEVGYDLFVSACTAILLAFMVAKLVSMAVCSGGEDLLAGVENGGKRMSLGGGGVEEVKSEKRLKVDGFKIKKKKVKNSSGDRVLVAELRGIAEPAVAANLGVLSKADDVDDDGEGFGSARKDIQFLGVDVDTAYLGDEALAISPSGQISTPGKAGGVELSVIQEGDDQFALDGPFEGLKEEIGRPIEGFDQVIDSAYGLDELIGHGDNGRCRKDEEIGKEISNCDFREKEDSLNRADNRGVGVSDQELADTEPMKPDRIEARLLGSESSVDNHDEHRIVSESVKLQWKDHSDQVDDRHEEIGCSASKDKGGMEISDGEEWEGIETNELERDFAKAMNFVQCSDKEGGLNKLGSDVLMELHSLQKAAIDEASLDPQSIALNLSARAKWNAWTKSGSMNQEEAMEKYIALLSEKVPGWVDVLASVEGNSDLEGEGECGSSDAKLSKPLTLPLISADDSKAEEERAIAANHLSSVNKEEE